MSQFSDKLWYYQKTNHCKKGKYKPNNICELIDSHLLWIKDLRNIITDYLYVSYVEVDNLKYKIDTTYNATVNHKGDYISVYPHPHYYIFDRSKFDLSRKQLMLNWIQALEDFHYLRKEYNNHFIGQMGFRHWNAYPKCHKDIFLRKRIRYLRRKYLLL